jgi:hypothetical protein
MHEVTSILSAIEQGDPHAAAQLLPLVYDELRKLAADRLRREQPGRCRAGFDLVGRHGQKSFVARRRSGLGASPS